MVKGIARKVVVVRPERSDLFEQAFFIVRDSGARSADILKEACRVAESYAKSERTVRRWHRRYGRKHLLLSALLGGGAVGIVWLATWLLF
jgi:hypothetical protein